MSGHIYCAIIDCYPEYVKVGCTTNIDNRMNNLSSSSSHIDKFKCIFSIEVEQLNMYSIEKNIHQDIINAGFKRFKGREFFNCKPDDIKYIFDKYNNKLIKNNIIKEKLNEIQLEEFLNDPRVKYKMEREKGKNNEIFAEFIKIKKNK
jgi:predicted nuclease with TOPRIM domain